MPNFRQLSCSIFVVVVVGVTTLKMARKPVKLQKENLAGCAGGGKQSEGN